MADNQTPQAQYELPEGTGNNPQEDYNLNWEAADHAGGWLTAEIASGQGGSEGEWYTFDNTGKAKKAQADSLDNCAVVFMLVEDTIAGEEGLFLKAGNWWKDTWGLDPSKIYYLDQSTPGAWTTVQPTSGLIIVLGRCDEDTETFHIAEGGGGGGGGLNDHATLSNLAWSVAGHTMDTTLSMNSNRITQVTQITMNPQGTNSDVIQISQGSYVANPSFSYHGTFQYINKTGGATTTAWEMTGHYVELRQSDAVNTMGYIYGNHNILRAYENYGNGSDAMTGMWNDFFIETGKTVTGRVKGTYFRFHPEGTVTLQTYGTLNWIGPSSGGTLHDIYGSYQNIICASLGTITGDVYGHYSDMNISGTNRLSGNEYAFFAKSTSTGVTGTSYAYYAEGTAFDYFLYGSEDTVPSYLAGMLQVDNTIWSEGTTGATPTSGAGTRFMWIPSKQAVRAGAVDSSQWDDANIGQGSFCFSRYRSTASGADSFVTGWNCSASGTYGVAMGYYAVSTGNGASIALGSQVIAGSFTSIAIGQNITAGTSAKCFGKGITCFTDCTMIGFNLVSNTCYRAVYVGRNITGASGTNDDCYGFGQFIGFITGDDNWVFGKGVDAGNPLMSVGSNQLVIGMNSNLASIIIDGSSAGIGTPADINFLGDMTFTGAAVFTGGISAPLTGSGTNSEAYGVGSSATGNNSLAVGYNVTMSGIQCIGFGNDLQATNGNCFLFGFDLSTSGVETVLVGGNIHTAGANGIVAIGEYLSGIGQNTVALGSDLTGTVVSTDSVYLGSAGVATGTLARNVAIGYQFTISGSDGVAIGENVNLAADNSIAIGADGNVTGPRSVGIGKGTSVTIFDATAVGENTSIAYQYSVAFGADATVTGIGGTALGTATSVAVSAVAVGYDAAANHDSAIAIGRGATTTQANEMVIGATSYEIDHLRFITTGDYVSVYSGFGWVDKNIYIGSNPNGYTTDYPNNFFRAEALSKTINGSANLFSFIVTMNGGTGTANDHWTNWSGQITMQSVGGQHGNVRGIYQSLIILEGDFGDVSTSQYIAGQYLSTQFNEVTALKLWGSLYGIRNYINASDGEITDDVFGHHLEGTAIGGVTLGGSSYGVYLDLHTSWDWAVYVATNVKSFFGGSVEVLLLNLTDSTELTISTGAIVKTQGWHRIDTEGDAASDDLDTISGGQAGDRLILQAENDARTVVIKDGTGNIQCAGDFSLDNTQDTIELIYDGSNWLELSRSDNGA